MPCDMKTMPKISDRGHKDVDRDAPHIDEEVADFRFAAEERE